MLPDLWTAQTDAPPTRSLEIASRFPQHPQPKPLGAFPTDLNGTEELQILCPPPGVAGFQTFFTGRVWTFGDNLAAWDVHQARVFGRCEHKTGIAPFGRLIRQVMSQEPYRSAANVFWVVDNGTSHRGDRCQQRLAHQWPNLTVVHTPIHASWLNQIEIYFSIVQRKVLTPNDFNSLTALENRLLAFQDHYQAAAKPFQWRFTRQDLDSLLQKLAARPKAA